MKETGHDSSGCDHHRFGQWAVIWLVDSHGFSHDLGCVAEFETYGRRICPQSMMNSVLNPVRLVEPDVDHGCIQQACALTGTDDGVGDGLTSRLVGLFWWCQCSSS
ncbi:MAG: hypothetical protein EBY56_09465 [Actinobacteria bacterium]|nr:hypothetical protein [Actinomycetota bacterium]